MEAEDLNREASCQIWCGVVKWKPYEMNRLGQTITNDPNSGVTEGWGKIAQLEMKIFVAEYMPGQ